MRLEDEFGGVLAAVAAFNEGIRQVDHVASLYHAMAEMLEDADQCDKAIQLLIRGIAKVSPTQNLFSLYQYAAKMLERAGQIDKAAKVLNEGIARVHPDQNLFSLYQCAAEISEHAGQVDEAIELLNQGIARVHKTNLSSLYQCAAEILERAGRVDEAIEFLKQGIALVPPESASSLYQAMSALLQRASRMVETLDWLSKGLDVIPVGNNRHRLAQSFVYTLNIQRDAAQLDAIKRGTGSIMVEPPQRAVAEVLHEQVRGKWEVAAQTAASRRRDFPRYLDLAAQESLAWLCTGHPAEAAEALARFPGKIQLDERSPIAWLNALIFSKQGASEKADEFLTVYLDRPLTEGEHCDLDYLLHVWDEDAAAIGGQNPAFYFPALPPNITGLADTVIRSQGGAPILPQMLYGTHSGVAVGTVPSQTGIIQGITSPVEPVRILHLSDLHFGTVEDAKRWRGQLAEDLVRELR